MSTSFADLSHHQTVDLAVYKAAGLDRVVLKATEGTGFTDPTFAARWKQAGQLGLARVAYHFARVGFSGTAQFDFFLSTVNAAGGLTAQDRLALDAEDIDTPNFTALAPGCYRDFGTRAVQRGVPTGLVYTYRYYATHYGCGPALFPSGWQQLWLADYTVGQADLDVELGGGWTIGQLVARQFTDKGTVPGVTGTCDYNRVVREWLTTTEDDMFEDADRAMLTEVRDRIRGAVGAGQQSFQSTVAAVLSTVQQLVNAGNAQDAQLRAISSVLTDSKTAVLAALAALPIGSLNLSDDQLTTLSQAVVSRLQTAGVPATVDEVLSAMVTKLAAPITPPITPPAA